MNNIPAVQASFEKAGNPTLRTSSGPEHNVFPVREDEHYHWHALGWGPMALAAGRLLKGQPSETATILI